jgi:hypothetical protein
MALGNFCELGLILDRESYKREMGPEEVEECQVARWHYRQIQLWFVSKYSISVGESSVMPSSVFRRSLVEFVAAIVDHKYLYVDEVPVVEGCTATELNLRAWGFVEAEYPELGIAFTNLLAEEHRSFSWTGPDLKISQRQPDDDLTEALDFEDFTLFPPDHTLDPESDEEELSSASSLSVPLRTYGKRKAAPVTGKQCGPNKNGN